jgi:carboxylesterase type B
MIPVRVKRWEGVRDATRSGPSAPQNPGNLEGIDMTPVMGVAFPPQALADSIHAIWVRFATDGSLPWPEYDTATQLVFSLSRGAAVREPAIAAAAFLP